MSRSLQIRMQAVSSSRITAESHSALRCGVRSRRYRSGFSTPTGEQEAMKHGGESGYSALCAVGFLYIPTPTRPAGCMKKEMGFHQSQAPTSNLQSL